MQGSSRRGRGSTCGMPLSRMDLAHSGPASGVESSSHVTHASAQPVSRGALRAQIRAGISVCMLAHAGNAFQQPRPRAKALPVTCGSFSASCDRCLPSPQGEPPR